MMMNFMYTYISKTMLVEVYLCTGTGFAMIGHQFRSAAALMSNREERTIAITMLVAIYFYVKYVQSLLNYRC